MVAARKPSRGKSRPGVRIDRNIVLAGDVRQSPVAIEDEEHGSWQPDIAIWADAPTGMVWGAFIGPGGNRPALLLQALTTPVPPFAAGPENTLPGQLVVFDELLARELRTLLAEPRITVSVAPPPDTFDLLFESLFLHLGSIQGRPELDLSTASIKALSRAALRLWKLQPWQFMADDPAVEMTLPGESPVYACVLGGNREVFGVALYASYEDMARFRDASEATEEVADSDDISMALMHQAQVMASLHEQAFLVSFEPAGELRPEYRAQFVQQGWPENEGVFPAFDVVGGEAGHGDIEPADAERIALAVTALAQFCSTHEDRLIDEEYPVEETVTVGRGRTARRVHLRVPPVRDGAPAGD